MLVYCTCVYTSRGADAVDETKLQPWQAEKNPGRRLQPALGYLTRLQRRMEVTGFPPDDRLYMAAVKAQDVSAKRLLVELHYLSCGSGIGRPSRQAAGP